MTRQSFAAFVVVAASVVFVSHTASAIPPMQSPVEPTPTRSRWRDMPATPTPDYSGANHGTIRDARYELRLPFIATTR